MCGIAGVWSPTQQSQSRLMACLDSMRHRGPDDVGVGSFVTPAGTSVTLLFSRLSIIDLDHRSNQPMESNGVWLSMNGEIYNYREVRQGLAAKGVRFRTSSDTEVLLEGFRYYGWAVLDLLEGMWAFSLYEESTGRLSLCRDRFGEKPLHVMRVDHGYAYASEVKQLSILTGKPLEPDPEQIRRFLVNGYKALYKAESTFFRDVGEVKPGTVMHIDDDGSVSTETYWTPLLNTDEEMDFEDAVEGSKEKLLRSIELRLRSDVPLAFSLSGGVDSVALVSMASRELGSDVHGFTILNSDPRYEERALVEHVVAELGIRHTGIELDTDGFLERLRLMIAHRGAPVFTITYYVQWLLMQQIAKSGYKVVVGGTGADEIFSGYYDHHLFYIADIDKAERTAAVQAWEEQIKPYIRNPYLQDASRFVTDPKFRAHVYLESDRFESYLKKPFTEEFTERYFHGTQLRNRMLNELFYEIVPVIMHEEDLNAMSFSIENRSPYLDRGLMEFAFSIPTRHLVRNGRAKAVLREAARGIAPDAVLDNARKVGFNAPIEDLLDMDKPEIRDQILADSPIYDIVRREAIVKMLESRHMRNSESKFLFSFLGSKIFLEEFQS